MCVGWGGGGRVVVVSKGVGEYVLEGFRVGR